MLITEAMSDRLEKEMVELMREVVLEAPSVGDAEAVQYTKEFSESFGIGRMGRMTIHDGRIRFMAAPSDIDRRVYYKMDDHNLMDFVKAWSTGEAYEVPVDKMLQGPQHPEPTGYRSAETFYEYERRVLLRMLHFGPVTLVNPSCKTMSCMMSAQKSFGSGRSYVHVTSTVSHDWVKVIIDFVSQSKDTLRMSSRIQGTAYLGTNDPVIIPDRYVRLIPSPFLNPYQKYDNFFVQHESDRVHMIFERRKKGESRATLLRDSNAAVINPESLDEWLSMGKRGSLVFFLETSENYEIPSVDHRKVFHSPFMIEIPDLGVAEKWVVKGGLTMRVQGQTVFDVKGTGTYLSRRRLPLPEGFQWVDFSDVGTHWISYSSIRPHRISDMSLRRTGSSSVLSLGDVVIVDDIEQIPSTKFLGSLVPRRLAREYEECDFLTDDLVRINKCSDLCNPGMKLDSCYYRVNGMICPQSSARSSYVWFCPDSALSKTVPFLPAGETKFVEGISTSVGHFVKKRDWRPGLNYILPGMESLSEVVPLLHLFYKGWYTFEVDYHSQTDPDIGDGISMNLFEQGIENCLRPNVITRDSDPGVTCGVIAREIRVPVERVYRYLCSSPVISIWRPGTSSSTQFVMTSQVQVPLRQIFHGQWQDGTWASELYDIGRRKEIVLREPPKITLLRFLRLNYAKVQVTRMITGGVRISIRRYR